LLRRIYWRKRLRFLGKEVRIDTGVYFDNPRHISLDDGCWIDRDVRILAGLDNSRREIVRLRNRMYTDEPGIVCIGKRVHVGLSCIISGISGGIRISDECGLSAGCKLYAFSHHYRSKARPHDTSYHFGPMVAQDRQCLIEGPIFLGANTGVALNVVILPGVAIPENCFVAIGSVVYPGRFRANSIISGNPAAGVDKRFAEMTEYESAEKDHASVLLDR
jgi:acetyltransferase-like isoleucine patch superfamily enzyme